MQPVRCLVGLVGLVGLLVCWFVVFVVCWFCGLLVDEVFQIVEHIRKVFKLCQCALLTCRPPPVKDSLIMSKISEVEPLGLWEVDPASAHGI